MRQKEHIPAGPRRTSPNTLAKRSIFMLLILVGAAFVIVRQAAVQNAATANKPL